MRSIEKGATGRSAFCSKVVSAAKSAGFSTGELGKLERLIAESEDREEIISQAISTVLDLADIPPDDVDEIIGLLETAYENAKAGREPFSKEKLEKLEKLLRNRVSDKALARIEADLSKPNEELIGSLKGSLESSKKRKSRLDFTPKKQ